MLIGNIRADMHLMSSVSIQTKKKRQKLKCRTNVKIKTESKSHCSEISASTHLRLEQSYRGARTVCDIMSLQRLKLLELHFLHDFKLHLIR